MGKRERDEALSEFTTKTLSEMLEELLLDVVLQSHEEILKSRAICDICHTRCHAVHIPGQSNAPQTTASSSNSSPSGEGKPSDPDGSTGTGTGTPLNANGKDGAVYLQCTNCERQIAPNRYAPHLASCMGLPNARRGAVRNATTKTKISSEAGRSDSPYMDSEMGHLSDDSKSPAKSKGKSKAKRTDEAEFSLSKKRPGSPTVSPAKKLKKAKTTNSPIARAKTDVDGPGSPSSIYSLSLSASQSKIPSKLRDSSVLSSNTREQRSSSPESASRGSSPAPSLSTVASAPSIRSPRIPLPVPQKAKPKAAKVPKPPPKPPSPPRLLPPAVRLPEPDYLVDVEGEETGSSTDTDSD